MKPSDLKPGMKVQLWSGKARYGTQDEALYVGQKGERGHLFRLGIASLLLQLRQDGELYDSEGQHITVWMAEPVSWRGAAQT